jgi:hypothetical protein
MCSYRPSPQCVQNLHDKILLQCVRNIKKCIDMCSYWHFYNAILSYFIITIGSMVTIVYIDMAIICSHIRSYLCQNVFISLPQCVQNIYIDLYCYKVFILRYIRNFCTMECQRVCERVSVCVCYSECVCMIVSVCVCLWECVHQSICDARYAQYRRCDVMQSSVDSQCCTCAKVSSISQLKLIHTCKRIYYKVCIRWMCDM